jgi:2-polyprenyl-3-methyl-5-hydroxy-6-metoxy-1,4-benzoquinol methylase
MNNTHISSTDERLRTPWADRLGHADYEPPRKHWLVTAITKWAYRRSRSPNRSPLVYGATDDECRDYEYQGAYLYVINLRIGGVTLDALQGKDVLDLGCGFGGKTIYIAEQTHPRSIHGFDIPEVFHPETAEQYARARGHDHITYSTGYGEDLSFPDDHFDVVVSDDVIEHVKDPEMVFQEIYRVLRPGGVAILKFPSYKMITAHHYDSWVNLPGLHYLLPYRTWAAGLNHLLTTPDNDFDFPALPRGIATAYAKNISPFLNGIDMKGVRRAIAKTRFEVEKLIMVPYYIDLNRESKTLLRRTALFTYHRIFPVLRLQECFSTHLVFVGRKPL